MMLMMESQYLVVKAGGTNILAGTEFAVNFLLRVGDKDNDLRRQFQ
jgi:hypothetical protein